MLRLKLSQGWKCTTQKRLLWASTAALAETLAALAGLDVSPGQVAQFQDCMKDALRSGVQAPQLAIQLLQGFVSTNG